LTNKVQMEDVVTNSKISRDYYIRNYRAILGYYAIIALLPKYPSFARPFA